jgi:hypothetical protein
MDAAPEQTNWSQVAARAFEVELDAQERRRKTTMSRADVIRHKKALAEQEAKAEYQAGFAAGRGWAEGPATPKQLARVSDYIDQADRASSDWWATFGALDRFAFAAWPDRKDDRSAADDFWQEALGDDAHRVQDSDYLRGFGEGAADYWRDIRDEL